MTDRQLKLYREGPGINPCPCDDCPLEWMQMKTDQGKCDVTASQPVRRKGGMAEAATRVLTVGSRVFINIEQAAKDFGVPAREIYELAIDPKFPDWKLHRKRASV